ncbi:hypothetical protein [Leeuwenhoekiella parthenopeia]|uniref:Phage protein n=1 Tax=Leeuwenhoekiella parthenopeia TaxID=2890320 RepID=A0ABS8GUC5_9FLAO|nr:hypothetical protein [Leeuwenhoekiella parthenopeia]MCC4213614.1 hypothetical protein [Leeuwenhoekiella parthenopeia]
MKKKQIRARLNELKAQKLVHLKPKTGRTGRYYEGTYRVGSYSDLMFLVTNLIKVSALALEKNEGVSEQEIPDAQYNVLQVLLHALQLIPVEELELLDGISQLIEEVNGGEL